MRLLQCCWGNFVVLCDGPMDAEDHWLGFAWQMCNTKRPLSAFNARFGNINNITHSFFSVRRIDSIELTILLVLNGLRRWLQVEGEYPQLPFHRHRRRRIANRLVTSLIF